MALPRFFSEPAGVGVTVGNDVVTKTVERPATPGFNSQANGASVPAQLTIVANPV